MNFENIIHFRPEFKELVSSVDRSTLEEYYAEVSIPSDLSDKSVVDKKYTSPFISLIENTYFYDYVMSKYDISNEEWLMFILDINKLSWKLDTLPLWNILTSVKKTSSTFFSKYISSEELIDSEFVTKLELTVDENMSQLDFISTLFYEITDKIFVDNIISKSLFLEITIDGIQKNESKQDIIFRICNLIENHEQLPNIN